MGFRSCLRSKWSVLVEVFDLDVAEFPRTVCVLSSDAESQVSASDSQKLVLFLGFLDLSGSVNEAVGDLGQVVAIVLLLSLEYLQDLRRGLSAS